MANREATAGFPFKTTHGAIFGGFNTDLDFAETDKILFASSSQTIPNDVDIIFATGNITLTYVAPVNGVKAQTTRNISGTTTIDSLAGTTEVTTLTTGQATTLAPNSVLNSWLEI